MRLTKTTPPYKTKGATIRTFFDNRGFLVWLFIGFILLAVSLFWNRRVDRISPWNQFGGHSNGFYGGPIRDIYMAPQIGEYSAQKSLPIALRVNVPPTSTEIRITFKYRVLAEFHDLWLSLPAKQGGDLMKILVDHELMRRHPFSLISGGGTVLFQRVIVYDQMNDFLASPPANALVVADSFLIDEYARETGRPSSFIPIESYLSESKEPDFIWTTFVRPRIFFDGWDEFDRIIPITDAKHDADGKITLMLTSENPNEVIDITRPVIQYK